MMNASFIGYLGPLFPGRTARGHIARLCPVDPTSTARRPARAAKSGRLLQDRPQIATDALVAEVGETTALTRDDSRAHAIVEGHYSQQLGGVFQVLRGELQAGSAKGVGNG